MRSSEKIRDQVMTWLGRERAARVAIAAEIEDSVTNVLDQHRRLARTDGSIGTLESVLKFIDGETR